jgi:ribokinase
LGAQVAMVGCVGNDDYGVQLRDALLAEQIDCQAVSTVADSSGVALIVVDDNSQNAIVIVAGANGAMTPAVIDRFDAVLQAADVISAS